MCRSQSMCKRSIMFSQEFMKYLMNYQKEEVKTPISTKKEIHFKSTKSGRLAEIVLTVKR